MHSLGKKTMWRVEKRKIGWRPRLLCFLCSAKTPGLYLVCCPTNLGTWSHTRRHKKPQFYKHSGFLWSVSFTQKQEIPKWCVSGGNFPEHLVLVFFFSQFSHLMEVKEYLYCEFILNWLLVILSNCFSYASWPFRNCFVKCYFVFAHSYIELSYNHSFYFTNKFFVGFIYCRCIFYPVVCLFSLIVMPFAE